MKEKTIVAWSRTKESALALSATLNSGRYEVQELLTTVNPDYDRISIHGLTRVLIKRQAKTLRIPLEKTFIPCGENGKFHAFIYNGPIFGEKVTFNKGECVLRENRFYFYDLLHA